MNCNQCEQVAKGGCIKIGVCGKQPDVAVLQDLLIHAAQCLSLVAVAGRAQGVVDHEVNRFVRKAVFSTLTNVDFDPARLAELIREVVHHMREEGFKARTVTLKVRFHDFRTYTRAKTLDEPTDSEEKIRGAAFNCLGRLELKKKVRLIGVRVGHLEKVHANLEESDR